MQVIRAWHAAVALAVVFVVSVIAAVLSTPNYEPFLQVLSDLGVGLGAAWFNYGLVATAVLLAAFYCLMFLERRKTVLTRLGFYAGVASAVCLALVGLFDETTALHGPAALAFFSLATISIVLFEAANWKWRFSWPKAAAALEIVAVLALLFTHLPALEWLSVAALGAWVLATSDATRDRQRTG